MSDNGPEAAQKIAQSWARTMSGIRDPQLQVGWMRSQLGSIDAARIADVLTIVLARAEQREERYAVLLLRVSLALVAPQFAGLKRAVACFADARNQSALSRFLGATSPPASEDDTTASEGQLATASPLPTIDPALQRALESNGGRPLSLGERKSLARKRDRNLLARALRDPHPDVVRVLLDNPALTEIDVVRLCARRPIRAEVLAHIFVHPRWILRYRIRLALALNPHTPDELALQLLPHLTRADLRAVARSGDVSERVRTACAAPRERSLH
jgi:hypothetical protein